MWNHFSFLRLYISLILSVTCVWSVEDIGYLFQKAEYHAKELEHTLQQIETTHNIHKRSQDDIGPSLDSLCSAWYAKKHPSTTKPTTKDKTTILSPPNQNSKWPKPETYPFMVETERRGDRVKITFNVNHSSEAYAARINSIDYQKVTIDAPNTSGKSAISTVQFTADPSDECRATFAFYGSNVGDYMEVVVDVCSYNDLGDEVFNDRRGEHQLKKTTLSNSIPPPQFRVLTDPADGIFFIMNGENPIFEVDIDLYQGNMFFSSVLLWDWDSSVYLSETNVADITPQPSEIRISGKNDSFLRVEVISQAVYHDNITSEGEEVLNDKEHVMARLRVTVVTNTVKVSGLINLAYLRYSERTTSMDPIVIRTYSAKTIALQLPYKMSALPENTVTVEATDSYCDEGKAKDCILHCHAFGTDIQSIFIVKGSPYRPPVKSSSYLLRNTAHVRQDVGPMSLDTKGIYTCVAATKNGTIKSKRFELIPSPKVEVKSMSLKTLDNSTTLITCQFYTNGNISMSVTISDGYGVNEQRLDNDTDNVLTVERSENPQDVNLTLLVKTDQLRYPRKTLVCNAENEWVSGRDVLSLSEENIKQWNPNVPRLVKAKSSVKKGDDGKSTIICTASGKDLDMMVSYGASSEDYRIDYEAGNVRTVTETPDGRSLTLVVPTKSVTSPWSIVDCGAKNQLGDDWLSFDLYNHGFY